MNTASNNDHKNDIKQLVQNNYFSKKEAGIGSAEFALKEIVQNYPHGETLVERCQEAVKFVKDIHTRLVHALGDIEDYNRGPSLNEVDNERVKRKVLADIGWSYSGTFAKDPNDRSLHPELNFKISACYVSGIAMYRAEYGTGANTTGSGVEIYTYTFSLNDALSWVKDELYSVGIARFHAVLFAGALKRERRNQGDDELSRDDIARIEQLTYEKTTKYRVFSERHVDSVLHNVRRFSDINPLVDLCKYSLIPKSRKNLLKAQEYERVAQSVTTMNTDVDAAVVVPTAQEKPVTKKRTTLVSPEVLEKATMEELLEPKAPENSTIEVAEVVASEHEDEGWHTSQAHEATLDEGKETVGISAPVSSGMFTSADNAIVMPEQSGDTSDDETDSQDDVSDSEAAEVADDVQDDVNEDADDAVDPGTNEAVNESGEESGEEAGEEAGDFGVEDVEADNDKADEANEVDPDGEANEAGESYTDEAKCEAGESDTEDDANDIDTESDTDDADESDPEGDANDDEAGESVDGDSGNAPSNDIEAVEGESEDEAGYENVATAEEQDFLDLDEALDEDEAPSEDSEEERKPHGPTKAEKMEQALDGLLGELDI